MRRRAADASAVRNSEAGLEEGGLHRRVLGGDGFGEGLAEFLGDLGGPLEKIALDLHWVNESLAANVQRLRADLPGVESPAPVAPAAR